MSDKILNRQIVNLNADLSIQASINQIIPLNLRFVPDAVIIRQITYANESTAAASRLCAQIYLDLAIDQIIGSFPLEVPVTIEPETKLLIRQGFQSGTTNLQIQTIPTSGSGNGTLLVAAADLGQLSIILEFIKS